MATLKKTKNWFLRPVITSYRSKVLQNAPRGGEHSSILLTFIKLPFVIKIFVLSIFEWPFYTGFIVQHLFWLRSQMIRIHTVFHPSSKSIFVIRKHIILNIRRIIFMYCFFFESVWASTHDFGSYCICVKSSCKHTF